MLKRVFNADTVGGWAIVAGVVAAFVVNIVVLT